MYKRQNIGRVDIESHQIIFTDNEEKQVYKTGLMNDPELTPVSYTHLDVYKRQPLAMCLPLSTL